MKCQSQISGNKKKGIINLLTAELAQRAVKAEILRSRKICWKSRRQFSLLLHAINKNKYLSICSSDSQV